MGRKTKYSKEILPKVKKLAKKGLTDTQITESLGIARSNFYEWQKKYQDFQDTLEVGRKIVTGRVINAFLKRCEGFKYKEKKVKTDKEGNVETEIIVKNVIPDREACWKWMCNKEPEEFKSTPDPISGDVKIEIEIKLFGGEDES